MKRITDDLRVRAIKELMTPASIIQEIPCTDLASETTYQSRQSIHDILHRKDERLLVIIGPCSIHDPVAAIDYAQRLSSLRKKFLPELEIVMRVYFEKPRTTVGWKGLINDPDLDGSFQINKGLKIARELLLNINELSLPAGSEYLDLITPQYIADMVSWGAIGARTAESQSHRELASGLSCPVGFKNGTDGNIQIAVDAMKAASQPHHFLSVTKGGNSAVVSTEGNNDCHIILRGGKSPNYNPESIASACSALREASLPERLMIDASHANCDRKSQNQIKVCSDIASQIGDGNTKIIGVMIESNLVAGRQDLNNGKALKYGQSITDSCVGWEETTEIIENLAAANRTRRTVTQS